MKTLRAGIALGTNIEPRFESLTRAVAFLQSLDEGPSFLLSPVYETAPVDCPAPCLPFLNAAAEFSTRLAPLRLLDALQKHERDAGRPDRRPKNAPRSIDLDILYMGDLTLRDPRLTLPHPLADRRPFVLIPLADIVPDRILPGCDLPLRRMADLCDRTGIRPRHDLTWK